jgi:predicted nucleic acid-binding protein
VIVVDASAILELLLKTSLGDAVAERVFDKTEMLHAPHLLDIEAVHVLRRYARIASQQVERYVLALDNLSKLQLQRHSHTILLPRIWQLRHNLTAYDATYVALAELLDAPLLTCDRRLATAPGHDARIDLI